MPCIARGISKIELKKLLIYLAYVIPKGIHEFPHKNSAHLIQPFSQP